jgi:hypothetical protein
MTFPGAQHVYGIPERATNLALKPTAGVSAVTSLEWWQQQQQQQQFSQTVAGYRDAG